LAPFGSSQAGSEVVLLPKRTSGDARAYIDNRPRAGAPRPLTNQGNAVDSSAEREENCRTASPKHSSPEEHTR